jgi:hypothetical protein
MTGFVHAALGAALGRAIKNPLVAFGAGFGSHIIGDVVPHHDMDIGEVPLVFGTLGYLLYEHGAKSPQFWGALGAVCPDFEHISYELKKDPRRYGAMIEKWVPTHNGKLPHGTWPLEAKWGVMLNFSLFIAGLWLAGTLKKRSHSSL